MGDFLTADALDATVAEAVRRAKADRDAYWKGKIDQIKVIVRQAVELHAPKESARDPRWTRMINALYGGVVRVVGPLGTLDGR